MAQPHYISNKNESVRMFKSDLMELLSHVHPATPLVLYLPVVGYMLYAALWQSRLSILAVAGLFLLVVLVWTLLEYIIHRYVFHYEPKSRLGKQFHFIVHGVHHDYPNDARRLVMPPSVAFRLRFYFGRSLPLPWALSRRPSRPDLDLAIFATIRSIMRSITSP